MVEQDEANLLVDPGAGNGLFHGLDWSDDLAGVYTSDGLVSNASPGHRS